MCLIYIFHPKFWAPWTLCPEWIGGHFYWAKEYANYEIEDPEKVTLENAEWSISKKQGPGWQPQFNREYEWEAKACKGAIVWQNRGIHAGKGNSWKDSCLVFGQNLLGKSPTPWCCELVCAGAVVRWRWLGRWAQSAWVWWMAPRAVYLAQVGISPLFSLDWW